MASTGKKKTATASRSSAAGRKTPEKKTGNRKTSAGTAKTRQAPPEEIRRNPALDRDIHILLIMAAALLLFLSLLGFCGSVGRTISGVLFGVFGRPAYIFPFLLVYLDLFILANKRRGTQTLQRVAGLSGLYIFACAFFQLLLYGYESGMKIEQFYRESAAEHSGGGLVGGFLVRLFGSALGTVGAYVLVLIGLVLFAILLTQKPLLSVLRHQS